MADSQVSTLRRDYRRPILIITTGAVIGWAGGGLAMLFLFGGSSVVMIAEIGQMPRNLGVGSQTANYMAVESVGESIERLQSAAFARAVGARLNRPELASVLPGLGNGGRGALKARQLNTLEKDLIDIRVEGASNEAAMQLGRAVGDELIGEHQGIIDALVKTFEPLRTRVTTSLDQKRALVAKVDTALAQVSPTSSAGELALLLAARASAAETLWMTELTLAQIDQQLSAPSTESTRIVTGPLLRRPFISSLLGASLLGGMGGIGLAILCIGMFRQRIWSS